VSCALVLWQHARGYLPFFVDDAFISLRYAARLLHGQGLTWTDGERVEGYSNLLWVLAVAGVGSVCSDLVLVARSLGVVCIGGVFALLFVSGLRRPGRSAPWFCGAAALALALCGPVAAWSIAGLEQGLLALLLMAANVASESVHDTQLPVQPRATWTMSLVLGLSCVTRPDGALFTVSAVLAVLCARGLSRTTLRLAATLVSLPAAFTLAQLLFRSSYYGEFVPNTYHAKGAFTWTRLQQGVQYVRDSVRPLGALWMAGGLALGAAAFDRGLRQRVLFALWACALWLVYLVRIGGDIFPQRRHLVIVCVLLASLLLAVLQWLWERRHWLRFGAWLLAPALLVWLCLAQRNDPNRQRALDDRWHWSGQPVGIFLRRVFAVQHPLLAVDAAGALPYFYELPCLDMLGLNDRYIAEHPPADIGQGFIGHELGDGRYVLSRKPDLIAFWTPNGDDRPHWRSGYEMVAQPDFRRLYQLVTFETDDRSHTRTRLWVRRRDGSIGLQRTGDRLQIPGYLLQGGLDPVVRADRRGMLYRTVAAHATAVVTELALEPGHWSVRLDADQAMHVTVRCNGTLLPDAGSNLFEQALTGPTSCDVTLELRGGSVGRVYGLTLTRAATR
jgi:hypothetical protein